MPAKAGTHLATVTSSGNGRRWVPAFAGMTIEMKPNHLLQRHRGDQRQRRRGRIARPQPHDRARIEIARRRHPCPALPPPPGGLALGAQPQPFLDPGTGEREQVGIGRSRLGDGADQAQNSAFAAAIVQPPSSGIAR